MSIPLIISKTASKKQINILFISFVFAHILVIAASNYLVQIPIELFGFVTNYGTFSFPLIFLLSDLAIRIYGAKKARYTILAAMFPALMLSYLISVLFIDGNITSINALSEFNSFVARIVIASFCAYVIGQLLDIYVFNQFRKNSLLFIAPLLSTTFGSLIDTYSFYAIAFYQSNDVFMSKNWLEMASFDYSFKMLVSVLLFIPIYALIVSKLAHNLKKYSN